MNSEYNIFDDNNEHLQVIAEENPFYINSNIVNDENIDYKNNTKVKIKDKIVYLQNENYNRAISLQISGKNIMELILINFIYSLSYITFNYWEISVISIISLYGIYSIRNFNKNHLKLFIIYLILSIIIRFIICLYNFSNQDLNIILFFLFIHELIIFILLYKFYIKIP